MKYQLVFIAYWLCNHFASCQYQYPPPTFKKAVPNSCDTNKAALVEHFFTIIFSEFRNPPPVCVCVQMCANQATYCYPNGCLRRPQVNRYLGQEKLGESEVLTVENKKPIFLVDNTGNQVAKVIDEIADTTTSTNIEPHFKTNLHKYTLDNYKTIFKYRRLPKVKMQYNLREQVKNTKSNIYTDVANNRWPLNKMKQVTIGRAYQPDVIIDRGPISTKQIKSVPSIIPRFFKRDLRPSVNTNCINNEISEKIQTTEEPEKFSLEKLINDLIESSLDNVDNNKNSNSDINSTSKDFNDYAKDNAKIATPNGNLILSRETLDTSSDKIFVNDNISVYETVFEDLNNATNTNILSSNSRILPLSKESFGASSDNNFDNNNSVIQSNTTTKGLNKNLTFNQTISNGIFMPLPIIKEALDVWNHIVDYSNYHAVDSETDLNKSGKANINFNNRTSLLINQSSFNDLTTAKTINNPFYTTNNKSMEYEDDALQSSPKEMFRNIYDEDTIDSLSKRIDKLNNTSYELINVIDDHLENTTNIDVTKWSLLYNKTSALEEITNHDDHTFKNATLVLEN